MSTLIITLALHATGSATEYDYALSSDGLSLSAQGRASVALLPATSRRDEVVVVVPARAMSWHLVKLPPNIGKFALSRQADQPRLRAVLAGLMEEYLLDDPEQLHFAVFPADPANVSVWVAVCNRAWLHEAVQVLEASQRTVSRIVPEFAPVINGSLLAIAHVTGAGESAQLVLCAPDGVTVLPLGPVAVSMVALVGPFEILAEPAAAAVAEQMLKHPLSLQTRAQRQLQAAGTAWDLAQFDLSVSQRTRFIKSLSRGWQGLSRGPQWRPVRWGMVLMALTHVLGLNIWAWQEESRLDEKRAAIRALFIQTFPEVTVIVDAPRQMEREVAALQQATGSLAGPGLIEALMVVANAAPAYQPLHAIEGSALELRLKGPPLSAKQVADLVGQLAVQGLRAKAQGELITIATGDRP